MALLIDSSLNLNGGIVAEQSYLRLEYSVNRFGGNIQTQAFAYLNRNEYLIDKEAIEMQKGLNFIKIKDFVPYQTSDYNKEIDGEDVIGIVHNNMKTYLTTDLTMQVKVLDPSTGQPKYETVIVREKFATPDHVFIVDISLG